MNIKALFLALSRVNAFIIFGLSKQFKDDDDEFQRRVNAFIVFGLSPQKVELSAYSL